MQTIQPCQLPFGQLTDHNESVEDIINKEQSNINENQQT